MIDLSATTFVPELTVAARYNGTPLEHGLILALGQEGRGKGDREIPPIGERAFGYVRECEPVLKSSLPRIRDIITVAEADGLDETDYVVRGVISRRGGAFRLLLERKGSRHVETGRQS